MQRWWSQRWAWALPPQIPHKIKTENIWHFHLVQCWEVHCPIPVLWVSLISSVGHANQQWLYCQNSQFLLTLHSSLAIFMKPLHIIYNLPLPLHHTQHSFARSLTPAYGSLYTGRTSSRNYTVLCAYILLLLRRSARSHAYVLVLVITTAKTGGEPAGDNKTADPIAISAVGTPALSMQVHGTSVQWVLIYGLARPMTWRRWSTAFSDSIRIFV